MSVAVNLFNANTDTVTVAVNNGTQFEIGGTGPLLRFIPKRATQPLYFSTVAPSADTFGPGQNTLVLTPSLATQQVSVSFTIPSDVQVTSLQVYVFWQTAKSASCVALNNGQLLAAAAPC